MSLVSCGRADDEMCVFKHTDWIKCMCGTDHCIGYGQISAILLCFNAE